MFIYKDPKMLVLGNVANAFYIDRGQQFREVCSLLEGAGCVVHWRIICPKDVGVPMRRRRLYVVAIRMDLRFEFAWPTPQARRRRLLDILGSARPGGSPPRSSWGPVGPAREPPPHPAQGD